MVDSDDWLDQEAYLKLLARIKEFCDQEESEKLFLGKNVLQKKETAVIETEKQRKTEENIRESTEPIQGNESKTIPDLFICNYVYDHLDEGKQRVMDYKNVFPKETLCNWNTIRHFHPSQYLIMHALMFRTEVLRKSGVILPEHTFYVDNLFSYQPLPYAENLYYMDLDLYHYYLGRDDQSVNEKVLMKRIDQQIKVTDLVSRCVDLNEVKQNYPKLAAYMRRNISIMLAISSIHLLLIQTAEAWEKRKAMWLRVKEYDKDLYYRLRYSTLSGLTYLPGRIGGGLTVGGYRLARKIYQFQ